LCREALARRTDVVFVWYLWGNRRSPPGGWQQSDYEWQL